MDKNNESTSADTTQSNPKTKIEGGTDSPQGELECQVYSILANNPALSLKTINKKIGGFKKDEVKQALHSLENKHLIKSGDIPVTHVDTEKAWSTTTHPEEYTQRNN